MRKLFGLGFVAAVCLLTVAVSGRSNVSAAGRIRVDPGSGDQYQYFTFTATGWQSYEYIHVYFTSPEGRSFTWVSDRDSSDRVLTDGDGYFSFRIHPVEDFTGASSGTWTAHFESDRDTEAVVDFDISL